MTLIGLTLRPGLIGLSHGRCFVVRRPALLDELERQGPAARAVRPRADPAS
jgi:hypothetical protein